MMGIVRHEWTFVESNWELATFTPQAWMTLNDSLEENEIDIENKTTIMMISQPIKW